MISLRAGARSLLIAHLFLAPGSLGAQTHSDPLTLPLALHLSDATVEESLRAIIRGASVRVSYSSDLLPHSTRITFDRDRTTVGEALNRILSGTDLGITVTGSGHIVIIRAELAHSTLSESKDAIAMRPQQMDRVIVMGTPAAGAREREVTTTVAVVAARQIADVRASSMADVFHSNITGVVAWDLGATGPIPQVSAVRGSSSFVANYLKSYLDGVELASPYMLFAIPTEGIERLEVIQGPQGSALYGSDAISGIAHVITKKGSFGSDWRPRIAATASAGSVESAFAPQRGISQQYSAATESDGTLSSFRISGTRSVDGEYVTSGGASKAHALATGRALFGTTMIEGTVRTTEIDYSSPVNPFLKRMLGARTPSRLTQAVDNQTIHAHTAGLMLMHEPSERWRQTLIVGYDQNVGALPPQRHAESVADALLGASDENARRASLRYSISRRAQLTTSIATMITAGVERSRLVRERSGPPELIDGAVPSGAPSRRVTLYADTMSNTGTFAQWKMDVNNALFVVAGLRAERNSSFGAGYGTAWAPMAGVSYIGGSDALTVKTRAAYGTGIRPPSPSARRALSTAEFRQLANPGLAPETQSGAEGGVDLYFAKTLSLSVTGFDQSANGLIQHVLPDPRIAPRTIQQQNVGRISNRGVEATARTQAGWMHADVSFAGVRSTVKALSRFYTGDMRVGDRVPEVPAWTSTATVGATYHDLNLDVGVAFIGPWTGYDWLSYYQAQISGNGTPAFRDYLISYPSAGRARVVLSHDIAPGITWFARVDNLTNAQRDTRDNMQITAGRTTWVGATVSLAR